MRDRRAFLLITNEQYGELAKRAFSGEDPGAALSSAVKDLFGERLYDYIGRRYGSRGVIHLRVTGWN